MHGAGALVGQVSGRGLLIEKRNQRKFVAAMLVARCTLHFIYKQ
jgi:hypothetical protein